MNAINKVFTIKDILQIIGEYKYYFELYDYIEKNIINKIIPRYERYVAYSPKQSYLITTHYLQENDYHIEFILTRIGCNVIKISVIIFKLHDELIYEYIEDLIYLSRISLLNIIYKKYPSRYYFDTTTNNRTILYFIKKLIKN
jgi:hypothetical protein